MRASFDKLISWTGVLLAAFLLIAGAGLTYAYFYIGGEVDAQLSAQDITMPEGARPGGTSAGRQGCVGAVRR